MPTPSEGKNSAHQRHLRVFKSAPKGCFKPLCPIVQVGGGGGRPPQRGTGDRGRTTRATVCRPPLWKTAPPHTIALLVVSDTNDTEAPRPLF
ncbi:MAG: hypothetical protein LBK25_00980 [Treponema sp.]|nr:hypothetical protein [Treponema sp.]